ncbi:MAG: hypothetical protein IJS02_02995 [Bacteroidales bacterium]|nr:hypothetical protein [Bacteroidales bacterium]
MTRRILLTAILCLAFHSASSQEYAFQRNSVFEIGIGMDQYLDKAASSAILWDLLLTEKYTLATEKDRMLRFFSENAAVGFHSLKGGYHFNIMNLSILANAGYAWTYNLHGDRTDNFRLWAGGSVNDHLDIRIHSSYFPIVSNFFYLGGDLVLQYSFDRFNISSFIKLPLISLVSRPSYAIIGPAVTHDDDVATYFNSFDHYVRGLGGASCDIGFSWKTKREKQRRISYRWEYFSAGRGSSWDFKAGMHTITYSVSFKQVKR